MWSQKPGTVWREGALVESGTMSRGFCTPSDAGWSPSAGPLLDRYNYRFVNCQTFGWTNRENRRNRQRTESQIHRLTCVAGAFRSRSAPFVYRNTACKWLRIWTYPWRREIAPTTRMPAAAESFVLTPPLALRQGMVPVVAWPLRHAGKGQIRRLAGRIVGWCPRAKRGSVRGLLCGHLWPAPLRNLSHNLPSEEIRAKRPRTAREYSVSGLVVMSCSTHRLQPRLLARQRLTYTSPQSRHTLPTKGRALGARADAAFWM
jgi:hypothetical protein